MLNIHSILKFVCTGVKNKDPRFTVIDDEHIIDTKTGVEYHLYDDYGKVTYDGEVVAKLDYFTKEEQELLWDIKHSITDPDVVTQKLEEYPTMVKDARETFASLYENPQPILDTVSIVEEPDTIDYGG